MASKCTFSSVPAVGTSKKFLCAENAQLNFRTAKKLRLTENSSASAARVWFTFKYFGFDNVYILNGGLKQWLKDGNSILHEAPKMNSSLLRFYYDRMKNGGRFSGQPRRYLIASYDEVNNFARKSSGTLVDCRLESEKRGCIPGSQYFPISEIMDPGTALLRSVDELRRIFQKYKIDLDRPIIAYSNRNSLASSFVFAARTVGVEKIKLYDGKFPNLRRSGWSEWSEETAYKLKTPFKICVQYPS
uniref:Rhodanese domain-containing protein n=1 Tax=Romanomermis culicivorax TaxID=13658 RepID=A0A915IN09_ROMCU